MDKRCRASLLAVVWGLILCLPVSGFSAEKPLLPGEKAFKSDSPVNIASDRMETNQTDRTILFEGHVIVKQDDLTITGQRMRVYAAVEKSPEKEARKAPEKGSDQSPAMMQKIDRIEIEGDVKISQGDKVAVAEKAVYYHQEDKIALIGNPSVSQGKDTVKGRLITLYISQGRSVVEGGGDAPVHAVLHPSKKE